MSDPNRTSGPASTGVGTAGPSSAGHVPYRGSAVKKSKSPVLWIGLGVGGCGCLAFMGILAAILIPNFLDALEKAKQKQAEVETTIEDLLEEDGTVEDPVDVDKAAQDQTVTEMKNTSRALLSWLTDEGSEDPKTVADLAEILEPMYSREVARVDGWGHPFRFECWRDPGWLHPCGHFMLVSPGRDGVFEHENLRDYETAPAGFPATEYDRDIVFRDGYMFRYPKQKRK